MSTRVITSVAAVGMLVLASCMQDNAKAPLSPTEPLFAPGTVPTCSFSTINNDAKAYFTASSGPVKDEVFGLITTMQNAYKTGATPAAAAVAATGPGFQVLGRLSRAVGTTAVNGTAAQGNTFANDVLLCMSVAGYSYPTNFTAALGNNGLFAVRAGTLNTGVISRGNDVNGKPLFGAEPSGDQWHASVPYLLFWGYTIASSDFTVETNGGQAFQLNELPTTTFPYVINTGVTPNDTVAGPIRAGVCRMEQGARILHEHSNRAVILPNASEPKFCTTPPSPTTNVGFRGLMQRVGDWLAPRPLYAFVFGGGGSALVGDLSPLGPVTFNDTLAFVQNVPNAKVSDTLRVGGQFYNPTIQVRVYSKSSAATPLAGILVTLKVVGNNGSYIDSNKTAVTDEFGIASFPTYAIDKPGGYTISATDEFNTVTISNQFNISGQ